MHDLSRLALLGLLAIVPRPAAAEISDAFAAMVTPPPAEASAEAGAVLPMTGLDHPQSYVVISQPVQTLLEHVAREAGLRLKLTDQVKGLVRDLQVSGRTAAILDRVADEKGLEWFAFNGVIHVSARTEAVTRLIRLGNLSQDQAVAALTDAGLPASGVETRSTSAGTMLAMSGPPDLLAIAETVIESIPPLLAGRSTAEAAPMVLVRRGNDEGWVTLRRHSVPTYPDP